MIIINDNEINQINKLEFTAYKIIVFECDSDSISMINIFFKDKYFYKAITNNKILIIDNFTSNDTILQFIELIEIEYLTKVKYSIIENVNKVSYIEGKINNLLKDNSLLEKFQCFNDKDLYIIKIIDNLDIQERINLKNDIIFKYNNLDKYKNDHIVFKQFINDNLNIAVSSRNQFLHRNTLIYKLDRFFEVTGLDLRNFNDAMIYKLYIYL